MIYNQTVQLVIFLSIFNDLCICQRFDVTKKKRKNLKFERHLNQAEEHLSMTINRSPGGPTLCRAIPNLQAYTVGATLHCMLVPPSSPLLPPTRSIPSRRQQAAATATTSPPFIQRLTCQQCRPSPPATLPRCRPTAHPYIVRTRGLLPVGYYTCHDRSRSSTE